MPIATLTKDLSSFFDAMYPDGVSDGFRKKALQLFDDAVERHAQSLLTFKPHVLNVVAINEEFKDRPEMVARFIQMYVRSLAAKSQAQLLERKIDVRKLLAERLRLTKAEFRVNNYRRRMI